jgi:hypothetical protein
MGRFRVVEDVTRRAVGRLKTWFDPPLDADATPLEIREAVIDDVERHAAAAAAGRRVLPHNHVTVAVLAAGRDDRAALEAALADVSEAIRARLREIRCPVPNGFEVSLQFVKRPKPGWRESQRLSVEYATRPVTRAPTLGLPALPELRLKVLRGHATQRSYTLSEPHVRVGRTAAPVDHRGRPRQNHIAFIEDGDEHSATVGRAHASIQYDTTRREYRLFDDGSHNGTRVVRGGTTLHVAPHNPVGVTILSGDELQFGTAAVTVEITEPSTA